MGKPAQPLKTPCPICRETIAVGAIKCVKCGSELTWRRYLSFSNTTLALLTALFSVIGAYAPVINDLLFTKDDSDIRYSFIGPASSLGGEKIFLLATNKGKRAGAVTQATLVIAKNDGSPTCSPPTSIARIPLYMKDNDPAFVAEKTGIIDLRPSPPENSIPRVFPTDETNTGLISELATILPPKDGPKWFYDAKCCIDVITANASGTESSSTLNMECRRVGGIVAYAAKQTLGR
jgi:hypothetical protein